MRFKKQTEIALEKCVPLIEVERLAHAARVATSAVEVALSYNRHEYRERAKRARAKVKRLANQMNLEVQWPAMTPEFTDTFGSIQCGHTNERRWWRFDPREA